VTHPAVTLLRALGVEDECKVASVILDFEGPGDTFELTVNYVPCPPTWVKCIVCTKSTQDLLDALVWGPTRTNDPVEPPQN